MEVKGLLAAVEALDAAWMEEGVADWARVVVVVACIHARADWGSAAAAASSVAAAAALELPCDALAAAMAAGCIRPASPWSCIPGRTCILGIRPGCSACPNRSDTTTGTPRTHAQRRTVLPAPRLGAWLKSQPGRRAQRRHTSQLPTAFARRDDAKAPRVETDLRTELLRLALAASLRLVQHGGTGRWRRQLSEEDHFGRATLLVAQPRRHVRTTARPHHVATNRLVRGHAGAAAGQPRPTVRIWLL